MQSASSFDNTSVAGAETFNPTEAGSRLDHVGPHSTSRLLAISTSGNVLRTRTQMAFWLAPGERSAGQLARNTERLSSHVLEKEVRIGVPGWPNVLDYTATFQVPAGEPHHSAQFEALTGYMPPEFSEFYRFDRRAGELLPLSRGPGEQADPVVFATADRRFAMGVVAVESAPAGLHGPGYGRWQFTAEKVVKWNCVFRQDGGVSAGAYRFRIFVPLGSLDDVRQALRALAPSL